MKKPEKSTPQFHETEGCVESLKKEKGGRKILDLMSVRSEPNRRAALSAVILQYHSSPPKPTDPEHYYTGAEKNRRSYGLVCVTTNDMN